MDPATLAAEAVAFVTPYLLDFAKNLGSDAASDGAKSVWAWIKGKLATDQGRVVADAETAPKEPENIQILQATLTKALGHNDFRQLTRTDLVALTPEAAAITGLPYDPSYRPDTQELLTEVA